MLQIDGKLDATFADPLALMSDCHRRIEKFLAALLAVAEQNPGGSLSAMEREALDTALRYFRGMAPKHTADEEDSLFPRLRAALEQNADDEARAILAEMRRLEADHDAADEAHAEVDRLGTQWLEEDLLAAQSLERLRALLATLSETYAAHIALEDHRLFPYAAEHLDGEALTAVGVEMAVRREHRTCSQRKQEAR